MAALIRPWHFASKLLPVAPCIAFLCSLSTTVHAQSSWSFRDLHIGMMRSDVDALVNARGSEWVPAAPLIDRRTQSEKPTLASAGHTIVGGDHCSDRFAVVVHHRGPEYGACILFSSIALDYAGDTLQSIRIFFEVEGTIPGDSVVRLLIEEFSNGLADPVTAQHKDGGQDYSGEIQEGVRTYARWANRGIDARLIESRQGIALVVRGADR